MPMPEPTLTAEEKEKLVAAYLVREEDWSFAKDDDEWADAMARFITRALVAVPRLALAAPVVGELQAKYDELLFAVATKHPGETRHQTALRYIQRAEQRVPEAAAQAKAALTGEEGRDAD